MPPLDLVTQILRQSWARGPGNRWYIVALEDRLDQVIDKRLTQMGTPGAIVSLSIPNEVDYVKAFGIGDTATAAPMHIHDHVRIGSVTKTFTGTALLQLVDQGRVRLIDPISRYVHGVPRGDEITVNMLGRMRSGLPNYSASDEFIARLNSVEPDGPTELAFTSQELLGMAFARQSDFAPDENYAYSNTNGVLLGLVIENVAGTRLGDYLQHNVFDPVGLSHTSYPRDGWLPEPHAHGYLRFPNGTSYDATLWNPSWADAAGKIVSTVADLRTWLAALSRGALLQPDTHKRRLVGGTPISDVAEYAFAIFNTSGWIGHNGDIPGYTTVAVCLPDRKATLAVVVNCSAGKTNPAGQLAHTITSIVTPEHVYF